MRRKTVSKNTLNAFFLCLFSPHLKKFCDTKFLENVPNSNNQNLDRKMLASCIPTLDIFSDLARTALFEQPSHFRTFKSKTTENH